MTAKPHTPQSLIERPTAANADGGFVCGYCDDLTTNEARCHRCGQAGRITPSEADHEQ